MWWWAVWIWSGWCWRRDPSGRLSLSRVSRAKRWRAVCDVKGNQFIYLVCIFGSGCETLPAVTSVWKHEWMMKRVNCPVSLFITWPHWFYWVAGRSVSFFLSCFLLCAVCYVEYTWNPIRSIYVCEDLFWYYCYFFSPFWLNKNNICIYGLKGNKRQSKQDIHKMFTLYWHLVYFTNYVHIVNI